MEISGVGIGIVQAITNVGMAFTPIIIGLIVDKTSLYQEGYFFMNMFIAFNGVLALSCSIWLKIYDGRNERYFEKKHEVLIFE